MSSMHLLTLRFRDDALEQAFFRANLTRTRQQGQFACLVGMFVYILHGVLDQWFVAPDDMMRVWLVRGVALCVPVLVLLILNFKPSGLLGEWELTPRNLQQLFAKPGKKNTAKKEG